VNHVQKIANSIYCIYINTHTGGVLYFDPFQQKAITLQISSLLSENFTGLLYCIILEVNTPAVRYHSRLAWRRRLERPPSAACTREGLLK
jgi:hypothetical protein